MSTNYDAWNAALASRFLQGQDGVPLYLHTDDDVLEELAGEVGVSTSRAADSFVAALQHALLGGEPFHRWATAAKSETESSAAPSYLGVLCFLVYVAVERDTVHFQYYPALNKYLGRSSQTAPPGFERDVRVLFESFNAWLTGPGRRHGLVTAAPTAHYPNVGWPLSQAIVRPVDRAYLVRMFAASGLRPGSKHSAQGLRACIVRKLRTAGNTPSRSRLLDLDHHHPSMFRNVLLAEFEAWAGGSIAAVGPARSRLRLCFDETLGEWWLLGPRVAGTEGKRWSVGSQSGTVPQFKGLEAEPPELWDLVGAGEVGEIEAGPVLVSRPTTIRWLSIDTAAGGWAEVQRRDPGQVQLALVPARGWATCGMAGQLEPREDGPAGYVLISVPPGFDLADDVGSGRTGDKPLAPRLEGGHPLNTATNTYLTLMHGLPVVTDVRSAVTVDEVAVPIVGGRASLSRLGLGPGDHVVRADGTTILLRLVDRLVEVPVDPGHVVWAADLIEARRVRVPSTGGSVWFLGAEGELEERSPTVPSWLTSLGLMANEVDVTGVVTRTWFEPSFVVSSAFMGKPWVEAVGALPADSERDLTRRPFDKEKARSLVADLMHDYRPEARKVDKQWKRVFAAMLRTVHR